jgi:decaprenyl-phosphate phosphoribosyltransferase
VVVDVPHDGLERFATSDTTLSVDDPGSGLPSHGAISPAIRTAVRHIVRAMRPRQWTKNLLVFVAPAAAGVLDQRLDALRALAVFGIFCAVASGTYLVNDAVDADADRRHPVKCRRPVAAGLVSGSLTIQVGVVLIALALVSAWFVDRWELVLVVAMYAAISAAYTIRLKQEPVVELAALASGFVLRAIAGGVATHVPLSNWFLVVTSFGALFVATGKRSAEHVGLGDDRAEHRAVLADYTPSFLRSTLTLTASVTVTAYCLWAFERAGLLSHAGHHFVWIQLTVIPMILGVLYVLWLLDAGRGGSPEDLLLHDRFLQVLGVLWLALFSIGLYG